MKKIFIVAAMLTQLMSNGMEGGAVGIRSVDGTDSIVYSKDVNWGRRTIDGVKIEKCCLRSICIPSSLTRLEDHYFSECRSLESVFFEEASHIKNIREHIFEGCSALKSIRIPSSVTKIGRYSFRDCTSLEFVDFEGNSQITDIEWSVFNGCGALKIINFGFSIAEARYFAAADLSMCDPKLEPMDIPEGVEEFYRKHLSSSTGLGSIFVPAGMKIFDNNRYWGVKVDNSIPSNDFTMIRVEHGKLKAFCIPNYEKIRIIWLDGTKLWFTY
ncbi:MAG: leucine-rich repeat domain-containing protein [Holosporaceae bacterium]|jgi:hypothetical protein|nr:leucine-rich repeat domain-containing protein [Holosporaceae bacterium]